MNPRAQQAREHHRKAADASRTADQHRAQRDDLVRQLWATERDQWTHAKLAKAVGCSPELIAKILRAT
ncbi:MAG: hypothetical protein AB1925_12380 [Actinomycetota bacterium]